MMPFILNQKCFNPCYVGCCSGMRLTTTEPKQTGSVSILVMLDVARESNALPGSSLSVRSFNPCYVGCCSGIESSKIKSVTWKTVSILVMLDVAREYRQVAIPFL